MIKNIFDPVSFMKKWGERNESLSPIDAATRYQDNLEKQKKNGTTVDLDTSDSTTRDDPEKERAQGVSIPNRNRR